MTPVGKRARPGTAPAAFAPHQVNRLLRASERVQALDSAGGAHTPRRVHRPANNLIRVRNDSGADRARFDILGIDSPVFGPDDNLDEFVTAVTLKGVTPADAHRGRFAVLVEPIAEDRIGWAAIDGLVTARVLMVPAATASYPRKYADIIESDHAKLSGRTSGSAAILWAQDEGDWLSNVAWCVLRLGVMPPAPIPHIVKVKVVAGGTAGDEDTVCNYTYDIWAYDGDTADNTERLATGLAPESRRVGTVPFGQMVAAENGSFGVAHYDPDTDAWKLIDVPNERFATEACA